MNVYLGPLNHFSCLAKGNPQKENFLSEAFVFVLRKLLNPTSREGCEFVKELLGNISGLDFSKENDITITREEKVEGGRLDIKIETPDKLIYVENKVESSVSIDQLNKYKSHLGKQNKNNSKMILITKYGIEDKVKSSLDKWWTWDQIYHVLITLRQTKGDNLPEIAMFFIEHLIYYLKEEGMITEKVSSAFIEGVGSMINLIEQIRFVLNQKGCPIIQRSAGEQFNGFYFKVDKDSLSRQWLGIFYYDYYKKPSFNQIVFELSDFNIQETDYKGKFHFEYDRKRFNVPSLLFNFKENQFFTIGKDEQLKKLAEFIQEGINLLRSEGLEKENL